MNRKAFFKIAVFSLSLAVLLSFCSLLFLVNFANRQGARFRDEFLMFYSASIERKIQDMPLSEIKRLGKNILEDDHFRPPFGPPPPPPDRDHPRGPGGPFAGGPPHPPPMGEFPPDGGPRPPRPDKGGPPQAWLVTHAGDIITRRRDGPEILSWRSLNLPARAGVVASTEEWFGFGNSYCVVRLNTKQPLYLVVNDPKKPFWGAIVMTQAVLTCSMILIAILGSLAILFFYLRGKSEEARSVLRRLESGDLKARFEIKRFDEFGELLLDFNRMADEIETLVGRIHSTEKKRKTLLQELGHDLRTPLTSLKTNFEILQNHHEKLSNDDKTNLFGVLSGEIEYFKDLIEKLITIASLDEPHYKASTENIDLRHLISQEIQLRQKASDNKVQWSFNDDTNSKTLLGDSHLILRLVRNALDNAARYAENEVRVAIEQKDQHIFVHVHDDGPGLDDEVIKTFGERHEFRGRRLTKGGHFSLGLGSVIMKTIAELHHGKLRIENHHSGGAHLQIELPTA